MPNKKMYRIALVAAVLSAISWFTYVFSGPRSAPPVGVDDAQQFFQAIQDARIYWIMYGWSGVLGTLLGVPYLLAFYTAIKEREPLVQLGLAFAMIGTTFALIGFFKPLTLIYEYLPLVSTADSEMLPFLRSAMNFGLEVMELPWNLGSFLLFGLLKKLTTYAGAARFILFSSTRDLSGKRTNATDKAIDQMMMASMFNAIRKMATG